MFDEIGEVLKESRESRSEPASLFDDAYGMLGDRQFKGGGTQAGSRSDVDLMFGTVALYDSQAQRQPVSFERHERPEPTPSDAWELAEKTYKQVATDGPGMIGDLIGWEYRQWKSILTTGKTLDEPPPLQPPAQSDDQGASNFMNRLDGGAQAKQGHDQTPGNVELISAAINENPDGSVDMEYEDGRMTRVSKDAERVLEFDSEGRQLLNPEQDTRDFDKDGKLGTDAPNQPSVQAKPEEINRAVDELIQRGVLPDLEFFEQRSVPRGDGEIRQRQEPDEKGGVRTTTEYPNGITVVKVQQTIRGDDGRLTRVEELSIKGPEGFQESPKGTFVDKTGKPLARQNEDGTLTVFLEDQGKHKMVTEFPNGVRTISGEPETIIRDGKPVQVEGGRVTVFPEGASQTPDGTVIDKAGKPIAKESPDGSLTIFTADGTYTQTADGKVLFKKQPASTKPTRR
jgi:hypothetical protein